MTSDLEKIRCDAYNDDPPRVARVAESMPDWSRLEVTAKLLDSLGHPVRVAIAAALLREPLCVCELSTLLGMSSPAVMYHLKEMAAAGIVSVRKIGRFAEYHITDPRVDKILSLSLSDPVATGGSLP